MKAQLFRVVLWTLIAIPCLGTLAHGEDNMDAFTQRRRELAHRQRRIILNNDGCDALYFPKDQAITPENFLALRTSPLAGSQVDTVFYCSISAGFSNFTHNTKVGNVLSRQVGDALNVAGKTNATQALIDQGADALKLVVDWCHGNGTECFWSMRMNDTHDAAHRPDKPYPLFPPLKLEHPEYLVGSLDNVPRYGPWSSVDYGRPEIRDLAYRFIEEVCQNYDVDGIELDFCRHLCYFKSVAYGGEASDAERDRMTDLVRRVHAMTEEVGRKRGRPILVAIRVPDSVDYCRAVGLDLERWLQEGLIDVLVGSFYFQLNPWEYLVGLGHKYGVAAYAGFSESRTRGDAKPFRRNSTESYRARAARAWQAGVDGIYLFNYFNPKGGFLREIGDPETLRPLAKTYYATTRNRDPNSYLADGKRFQTVPILTPENPWRVRKGEPTTVDLLVGDDLTAAKAAGLEPTITLQLQIPAAEQLSVRLNGTELAASRQAGPWMEFPVARGLVKPGANSVQLTAVPTQPPRTGDDAWNVVYTGDAKPEPPWSSDPVKKNLVCEVQDGALLLADRGTNGGDYLYYAYPWNVDPAEETIVEARVKVVSGWNNLIVADGAAYERVTLYPDRIGFYEAKLPPYKMDTTDDFHTYRVVLKGNDIRVFVDGELRLDGTGKFTKPLPGRNDLRIGAANSPGLGEALWQSVKLRFASAFVSVYDMVLSVRFPKG